MSAAIWRKDGLLLYASQSNDGGHALLLWAPPATPQLVFEHMPQNYDYRFNPAGRHLAYKVGEARGGEVPQLNVRDLLRFPPAILLIPSNSSCGSTS